MYKNIGIFGVESKPELKEDLSQSDPDPSVDAELKRLMRRSYFLTHTQRETWESGGREEHERIVSEMRRIQGHPQKRPLDPCVSVLSVWKRSLGVDLSDSFLFRQDGRSTVNRNENPPPLPPEPAYHGTGRA